MGPGSGLQDPRLLQAEPRENGGSDSGLQDPRELQEKSGIRESGQEGSAGGFKILVFCRPGDRAGKKKSKTTEKKSNKTHGRPGYSDAAVNCTEDVSFLCDGPD